MGTGYLKKDSWISKIEDLIFSKNKISLLVNIEGANTEKNKQKQTKTKTKTFKCDFLHFAIKYCQY